MLKEQKDKQTMHDLWWHLATRTPMCGSRHSRWCPIIHPSRLSDTCKVLPIMNRADLRITLHKWWCRISKTKSQGFCLTLSLVILSGKSELPWHEGPPVALWRVPRSRGFKGAPSKASIDLPPVSVSHLGSAFSSPVLSLSHSPDLEME